MKKSGVRQIQILEQGLAVMAALLLALMTLVQPVRAQSSQNMPVSVPETSAYPQITFYFWPTDAEGNFISDLTADQVQASENGRTVKLDSVDLLEPGVHVIFAINEGTTLDNSYAGETRMNRMKDAWIAWVKTESITTLDDFSLVTNTGVAQNQLTTPSDWLNTLNQYNPDLRKQTPSLNSLSQALTLVEGLPTTDHKPKAILYVTPLPSADDLTTLQTKAQQAAKDNVRLFFWLIGPQSYTKEAAYKELQQDAALTGGSFFLYSGAETLPDLNTYFNPLSHEYKATYHTTLQKSGTYTLQVSIKQKDYSASSDKVSFDLKAEAPNPIFLEPPAAITLNWQQSSDKKTWEVAPSLETIHFMVEFPDGHERDLSNARLFVDGTLMSEVDTAPFNALKWDLSKYDQTSTHFLQIFITDSAGFTSNTIKTLVVVTVNPKPQTTLQRFLSNINWTSFGIAAFLVLMGIGLLMYFRRVLLKRKGSLLAARRVETDPVKQPVLLEQPDEDEVIPTRELPPDWPKLPGGGKAPARLLPLAANNAPRQFGKPIALSLQDTTFGNDPMRCDIVLTGPTIAPVHARIFTDGAKRFYIADCGTSAGTWINYAPVSQQGGRLQHGDLVNIGAQAFRFEQVNPEGRPIQVLPYQEE